MYKNKLITAEERKSSIKLLYTIILSIVLMLIILSLNNPEIAKEEIEFDQIYAP